MRWKIGSFKEMFLRCFQIVLVVAFVALGCAGGAFAQEQGADRRPMFGRDNDPENLPRAAREAKIKMQIEKDRKDHDEMLARGEEVRRLSERLEKTFGQTGHFSDEDRAALETLEKNVKKIRSELGGDDGDEKLDDLLKSGQNASLADALDSLQKAAANLADELQKTTRFTISAAAIQSSNAVLTVARFLRIKN
jgi:hypothetical protein